MENSQIAISSLLMLWEDVQQTQEVKSLCNSRLNKNCIDILFSTIRGKGGHRDNPSPKEFRQSLHQVMVDYILLQSTFSNCLEDGNQFLLTLSSITSQQRRQCTTPSDIQPEQAHQAIDLVLMDFAFVAPFEQLSMAEQISLKYIARYLARQIGCAMRTEIN
ncbi:transposable element p transposase [Plakobranchus ocellatus]|uniref:Transposable element p transposase n=1 Tax=Plakobranchus ocellatus TaxID=259542 RepID=A0AAV4A3W9_9GAST|nr:transposable element p transposase [Plakobranchus ocellatus]